MRLTTFAFTMFLVAALPATAEDARLSHETHCLRCRVPFGERVGEPERHYGRARPFDALHVRLELALDFEREALRGTATHSLVPIGEPLAELRLDAVGMTIFSVHDGDGAPLDYEVTPEQLIVRPAAAPPVGQPWGVRIAYETVRPKQGLYFRTERMGYRPEEVQAWTQGQPEDARYWFPCHDYPNERATSEIIATVPIGFNALSNGERIGESPDEAANTRTVHYRLDTPHVSYLMTLAAGPFVTVDDPAGDLPNSYYVLPGQEADVRASWGRTPDMLRHFPELIGVPYPYSRYGQVAVIDFVAGGMENTTLTTMSDRFVYPEAIRLTRDADWIVAHELAHQWFGDLVTCRDWSHIWLHEGFATYFEWLWEEEARGDAGYAQMLVRDKDTVLGFDTGDTRAPVVQKVFANPGELFNPRIYEKGGWVLHMLREDLGDELFWRAIQSYLEQYRGEPVTTEDFLRVVEATSGRNYQQFFDQWLYHGGYPELEVRYEWDAAAQLAKVVVKQKQKVDERTPLFVFDCDVAFYKNGTATRQKVHIDEAEHTFYLPCATQPDFVRFDPDERVLKKLDFEKSVPMWAAQLAQDPRVAGRIYAVRALAEKSGDDAREALAKALAEDTWWGVRAEAARALGGMDNDGATNALIAAAGQENARVRDAVAEALGQRKDDAAAEALARLAAEDPATDVVTAAIAGLAQQRAETHAELFGAALQRDSWYDEIRRAAISALAQLGDPAALDQLLPLLHAQPLDRRIAASAAQAVGRLGWYLDDKARVRQALVPLLEHANSRVRFAALDGLEALGDRAALPAIDAMANTARPQDEQERAKAVAKSLRDGTPAPEEVKSLREALDELRKERDGMKKHLDALEEKLEGVLKRDAA